MLEKHYELLLIDAGLGDQMCDITLATKTRKIKGVGNLCTMHWTAVAAAVGGDARAAGAAVLPHALPPQPARQPHHAHSLPSPRVAAMGPKHRPFVARTQNHCLGVPRKWNCDLGRPSSPKSDIGVQGPLGTPIEWWRFASAASASAVFL